jgi:N-acetylmuramoyl-L-alanine amidase
VLDRWGIPAHRVIGHSDMAPDRKGDPGARFDWARLARQGLSVWPALATGGDFRADLLRFGYPSVSDASLLRAFRLRFRPWADGPQDATDAALAADLAARFPVDGSGQGA